MKSLKCFSEYYEICGTKVKYSGWYVVKIGEQSDLWYIRFGGIKDGMIIHLGSAYVHRIDGVLVEYSPYDGHSNGLCNREMISGIKRLDVEFIRELKSGIKFISR